MSEPLSVPLPAAPVPDAAPAQSAINGGRFAVALKFSRMGSDIAVEVGAPTKEIAIDLAEEAARLARGIQKRRVGFQPKVGRTLLSGSKEAP